MDGKLSGVTTPSQNGLGDDVLQSSCITESSQLEFLVS